MGVQGEKSQRGRRELRPCGRHAYHYNNTQVSLLHMPAWSTAALLPLHPPNEQSSQKKPRSADSDRDGFGQGRARTRSLAGCTESSPVITGRYWGGQWQPGGSNQAGCHPAGCRWSPSDGLWWTGSFWIPRHRLHASPAWTRSSPPGPAGAAESSPWDTNTGIILDHVPELIVVCEDLGANKCIFKH